MKVRSGMVVGINYVVSALGTIIEQTKPGKPVRYIHGDGALIQAMEDNIEGMEAGEKKKFTILAIDGYGPRDELNVLDLPLRLIPPGLPVKAGDKLAARDLLGDFPYPVVVVSVDEAGGTVKVDLNHPLSGKDLEFDLEVTSVRPIDPMELIMGSPAPEDIEKALGIGQPVDHAPGDDEVLVCGHTAAQHKGIFGSGLGKILNGASVAPPATQPRAVA